MADVHTHGHHDSVLLGHTWRNLVNSAAYPVKLLKSLLKLGMSPLDVGCGLGTVTAELAATADAWPRWAAAPTGHFAPLHGEFQAIS